MHTPDNWVILRIDHDGEILYKILAGWSGGYLDGSSWRLNSGITKVEEDSDEIRFYSHSGSTYHCRKHAEQLHMNCSYVLAELQERFPNKVGVIAYSDFLKEFVST